VFSKRLPVFHSELFSLLRFFVVFLMDNWHPVAFGEKFFYK